MSLPPLILVPGLLCDAAVFGPQIDWLEHHTRVEVADVTQDETMAGMAERLLAVAPERFALAGLSMGGYVALEVMRRAPERVDRLALLGTRADRDSPEQARRRRGLIVLARQGRFRGVTPRLLPLLLHPARLDEARLTGLVMAMAERVGRDAFLRQQEAILGRADSRPDLARIACPTLVVVGREDALNPIACSEEMAAATPGAELVVLEDCGHLSTIERPLQATRTLARWLGAPGPIGDV